MLAPMNDAETPTPDNLPPTPAAPAAPADAPLPPGVMDPDEADALDAVLDALRQHDDEVPQWEFCDGFLTALVCCRRPVAAGEWLPVLLGVDEADGEGGGLRFASESQRTRFLMGWQQREAQVRAALSAPVESLDDARTLVPDMLDVRAALAELPEAERAEVSEGDIPSFGQVWALGFMYAVENWPDEWAPPRERELARGVDEALQAIVTLSEDDPAEPSLPISEGSEVASVSARRLDDYAAAIWAVYDLFDIWQGLGPRVATVRHAAPTPGRNDPCPCGSGKKYKKCCGA